MKTPRWHTREDSGLRIDRQGQWWHDDEKIEHPNIIEAFNRGLRVMEDAYRLAGLAARLGPVDLPRRPAPAITGFD